MGAAGLEYLDEGRIGEFWRIEDVISGDEADPMFGWLTVDYSTGRSRLEAIDKRADATFSGIVEGRSAWKGSAVVGLLPNDCVLLLDPREGRSQRVLGGARVSTVELTAAVVIGQVQPWDLRSARLRSVVVHYPGLAWWAYRRTAIEEWETDADGRTQGFTLKLGATDPDTAPLGSLELTVDSTWSVLGHEGERQLSAPITIGVSAPRRPVEGWKLLRPLHDVHGLLAVVSLGLVVADGGTVRLHTNPSTAREQRLGSLWCGPLMVVPKGVRPRTAPNDVPLVSLATLGGAAGLARWCRLCGAHARATEVILGPYRHGIVPREVDALSLGSAIEYWVAAHRTAVWSRRQKALRKKHQTASFAIVMAERAGPSFADWVGDIEKWAHAFTDAYDGLKHDPAYRTDPLELADLVLSARYLLIAVLLNRVALSHGPARSIFKHHALSDAGLRLRSRW